MFTSSAVHSTSCGAQRLRDLVRIPSDKLLFFLLRESWVRFTLIVFIDFYFPSFVIEKLSLLFPLFPSHQVFSTQCSCVILDFPFPVRHASSFHKHFPYRFISTNAVAQLLERRTLISYAVVSHLG